METLLNLVWLVLALTSTTLWVVYWRHDLFVRGRRKQVRYSAVGLMCVLVLMFYAISLTDDLYEIAALVEDAALVSARSCKATVAQTWLTHPRPVFGVTPASLGPLRPHSAIVAAPIQSVIVMRLRTLQVFGLRSPPPIAD